MEDFRAYGFPDRIGTRDRYFKGERTPILDPGTLSYMAKLGFR